MIEHNLQNRRLDALPIGVAVDPEGIDHEPAHYEKDEQEYSNECSPEHPGRLALPALVIAPPRETGRARRAQYARVSFCALLMR